MHTITKYKYWIFDMDGTLTIPQHDFDEVCKRLDIPAGSQILEYIQSLSMEDQVTAQKILEEWELEVAEQTLVADDATSFLQHLHEDNAKMAILTRNIEKLAYLTLSVSGLLRYFEPQLIIARDTCTPKPSPLGIYKICEIWNIDPKDSVMVGDYIYDIQAGFEAGSQTILIQRGQSTGFTTETPFQPNYEIHTFLELL